MTKQLIAPGAFAVGLMLGLAGCTNAYDPGQRAVGGGLLGAGAGLRLEQRPVVVQVLPPARQSAER